MVVASGIPMMSMNAHKAALMLMQIPRSIIGVAFSEDHTSFLIEVSEQP